MTPKQRARASLGLASVGGVTFALSSPPTSWYPCVFIGLAALHVALRAGEGARRRALIAWVWAASASVVGLRFIPGVIQRFTPVGMPGGVALLGLLAAFQALGWAVGGAVAFTLERRLAIDRRVAFAVGVLLACIWPNVIQWTPAGLLTPWPALVQAADVVGERGLVLLFAIIAALIATPLERVFEPAAARSSGWRSVAAGVGIVSALGIYGAGRMREVRAHLASLPTMKLGVVQAAVEAKLRWQPAARAMIVHRLRHLTIEAERQGVDLVVWPEAAYPYVMRQAVQRTPLGGSGIVGGGIHGPVLTGLITRAPDGDGEYNAATIVDPGGYAELPQAKMQLLWFGETVPLSEYVPALRHVFFRAGGLVPGDRVTLLYAGAARIGVLNCYEDTLAGVGRRVARQNPNLLVNVTNDAWFGPTAEPELHLRLSVMRAIEARRDLVRAVNLGVPAWIDASGTIVRRGRDDAMSVMLAEPALNDAPPTFYTKVGDIPLLLGLSVYALGAWFVSRRRARGST